MTEPAAPFDYYGDAKATLRENVKWLATSFAGMSAILLAGAPFTGFGALRLDSGRFWLAFAAMVVGAVLTFHIWQRLLDILRPDITYTRFLRENRTDGDKAVWEALGADERDEYEAIKSAFDLNKDEFLPAPSAEYSHDFDGLEKRLAAYWSAYTADARKPENERDQAAEARWLQFREVQKRIRDWVNYTRLHQRVTRGVSQLKKFAGLLLVCLAVFAYTVNPGDASDADASPDTVMVDQSYQGDVTPDPPRLDPVIFATREHRLDEPGRRAVARARDYLRTAPDVGVLLIAHTDTVGGRAINIPLAARRAQAVKRALIEEGGIAATRIFIAELPESDLPVVTGQETGEAANRSVEVLAFRIPRR